ncbi:MAG: DUF5590 domain-containing protein, partial [Paenibacillaceae bacterium]
MPSKKIVLIGFIVLFTLLLFGLSQFFRIIQAGAWTQERQAVDTAYQKTIMTEATKVETFISSQTYKIVYGKDAIGQELIVWIGDSDIHTEYVADGLKEKDLRTQFAQKEPTAELLRILPGKLKEKLVWEVYYKKPNEAGKQVYFYDYVNF